MGGGDEESEGGGDKPEKEKRGSGEGNVPSERNGESVKRGNGVSG